MGLRRGARGHLGGFNAPTFTGTPTFSNGMTVSGGTVDLSGADVTNLVSDFMSALPEVTTALTNIDQRCYAVYLGRAPRKITTCDVSVIVGATAAVTVVYAELALATGAWEPSSGITAGTPELTLRAGTVADISAEVVGTNTTITKTITPSVPIPAGTELWAIVGVDAGTQPVWRATADDMNSRQAFKDSTRPSTMSAASVFTGGIFGNAVVCPHMTLHIAS
jgi:hypothetical protein